MKNITGTEPDEAHHILQQQKPSLSNPSSALANQPPLIVRDSQKGVKLDASLVAASFRQEVQRLVQQWKAQGIEAPLLVGLLANTDPAAVQYAEWTGRACQADGLRYQLRTLRDASLVEAALMECNEDDQVHGIIIYYPIFGGQVQSFSGASHDDYLRDSVLISKDVEGLCHTYRTNLYRNIRFLDPPMNRQKCLLPCTALSVVKLLEACPAVYDRSQPVGHQLDGVTATVINRSEIVGRPLAAMLSNDGAVVYSIDIDSIYQFQKGRCIPCSTTETPESCVRQSSIVITGVPTKNYRLPTEWIQPNSVVVNVASYKNVDEETLLQVPGVIYIPQVGKVTVAMLERNLVRLFQQFHYQRTTSAKLLLAPTSGTPAEESLRPTWHERILPYYTAVAVTALLIWEVMRPRQP